MGPATGVAKEAAPSPEADAGGGEQEEGPHRCPEGAVACVGISSWSSCSGARGKPRVARGSRRPGTGASGGSWLHLFSCRLLCTSFTWHASPAPLHACLTNHPAVHILQRACLLCSPHASTHSSPNASSPQPAPHLQQLTITAGAAALLHSAFPQLSTLKLTCCRMDTAAVAKALCSCPHLTHLTLVDPCHLDPEGLWAAAEAGAAAAGQLELLQAAAGVQDNPQETKAARSAAATGYLLRQLPATVTSLKLSMHWVLATFRLMVLKGLGRRLQELCMHQSESLTYPHMYILSTLIPALQACAGLASLEIGGIWAWQLCGALARCGTWAALRSLSLPQQTVGEALLEVFLENMPGEGWMQACHVVQREFEGCLRRCSSPGCAAQPQPFLGFFRLLSESGASCRC